MKGIELNPYLNMQTGKAEQGQKNSFLDFNLKENNVMGSKDPFANYLSLIKDNKAVKTYERQNENQEFSNDLNKNELVNEKNEKVDFEKTKIDQASKKETLDEKIEAVKKEIAQEIEKEEQSKKTKKELEDKIVNLLALLDKLIKAKKENHNSFEAEKLSTKKEELVSFLDKLKSADTLSKSEQKELSNLLKELNKLIDLNQNDSKDKNGVPDLSKVKDSKAEIKEILKDIKQIINENTENKINSENPKVEKENNKPLNEGIQFIHSKENNNRSERIKENAKQENTNNDTVNIQKTESKVNTSLENGESGRSDLMNSESKSSNFARNLKLSKDSSIKNPGELFNQIVSKAKMAIDNNRSEMRIQLEPKIMGHANIKIVVEKGLVTGQFIVENQAVKNFLEDNLHNLKESLQAQGLEIDQIDIYLSDKDAGQSEAEKGRERMEFMNRIGQDNKENSDNLTMTEDILDNRYRSPDWMAKEVDVQI